MKIARTEVFRYSLPFLRPLALKEQRLANRDGIAVRLISNSGAIGWGEIAPLPGFSSESLADAARQVWQVLAKLQAGSLPDGLSSLEGGFEKWLGRYALYPSVRCGIEMAVLNLLADASAVSVAQLLVRNPSKVVHVNGLIDDDSDQAYQRVQFFLRQGYRAVKLKVGKGTLDMDVERTRRVCQEITGRATLRLDANQSWSLNEGLAFAKGIVGCAIEYIEEPLNDSASFAGFSKQTSLPVALDESLAEKEPRDLRTLPDIAAVILKPTILGGLERAASFARIAEQQGMCAVISSSFESSLGIAVLGQLAAAYGTSDTPVGLDTPGWFRRDLLTEPIERVRGCMRVEQLARVAASVDMSILTEIDRQQVVDD